MYKYQKDKCRFLPLLVLLLAAFLLAGCARKEPSGADPQTEVPSAQKYGEGNSSQEGQSIKDLARESAEEGICITSRKEYKRVLNENDKIRFRPGYLSWQQGEVPADREHGIIYIPCSIPALEKEKSNSHLSVGRILASLKPDDEAGVIHYVKDKWMDDPLMAIEKGHRFEAVLSLPQGYMPFSVILTGLPTVSIRTDGKEFVKKEDHYGKVYVLPCYEYTAESTGTGSLKTDALTVPEQRSWDCKLHLRGNMSLTLDKKGWKLTLLKENGKKAKASLLGMRRDDDWVLNPLYSDYSRVREMTAYQLWNHVTELSDDPCYSSRMQYVEVFVDDAYHGVYGLMEPVDGKQLDLSANDLLYKINYWDSDYPYLDLYDKSRGDMEILNGQGEACIEIKYPKEWEDGAAWDVMKQYHMFTIRNKDPEMLRSAGLEADMDSVMTLSLFCALTQAGDNTWKNTYLVARKQPEGTMSRQSDQSEPYPVKYRLYRDLWDLNYVFGDSYVYDLPGRHTQFILDDAKSFKKHRDSTYDFEAFLSADPSLEGELRDMLRKWRENGVTPKDVKRVAEEAFSELKYSGALEREMQRWPQDQEAEDALKEMKKWVDARFNFLDERFGYTRQ